MLEGANGLISYIRSSSHRHTRWTLKSSDLSHNVYFRTGLIKSVVRWKHCWCTKTVTLLNCFFSPLKQDTSGKFQSFQGTDLNKSCHATIGHYLYNLSYNKLSLFSRMTTYWWHDLWPLMNPGLYPVTPYIMCLTLWNMYRSYISIMTWALWL